MDKNVGGLDRRLRMLGGIALLGYAFRTTGLRRITALLVGIELLCTAEARRCPLNFVLKVNTCPLSDRTEPGW